LSRPAPQRFYSPQQNAEVAELGSGIIGVMANVTQILSRIGAGDPSASEQLLPLIYDELRQLAAAKLAHEKPGQTLQPTALVHEAYLRLVKHNDTSEEGNDRHDSQQNWNSRGHFFAAAAEAMRRILIENARRKKRLKHGGDRQRADLLAENIEVADGPDELLALDAALTKLEQEDPVAANLVKLRTFAGLSIEQAGEALGFSRATAYRQWNYARAWLRCAVDEQ
jgi:RNA polymerase sigma factor (TIGR02999 family)